VAPQTCGGGGTANVCGTCTPTTCAAQGKNCGSIQDGCGNTLACGTCTSPQTCNGAGTANVCGCTPTTCAAAGKNCGSIPDGCGGTLNCGGCASGYNCNGTGSAANVCQPNNASNPCWTAYNQSSCAAYNTNTKVSAGGHNWSCANANCANCWDSVCQPGNSSTCPWGSNIWTDNGACQ
jgi:hypothetical protein